MVKIPSCLWHHMAPWKCHGSPLHQMLLCSGSGVGIGLTVVNEQCRYVSGHHSLIVYSGRPMRKQVVVHSVQNYPLDGGPWDPKNLTGT